MKDTWQKSIVTSLIISYWINIYRRHNVEFLLPSKARLAEAIKGEDESDEETEGDMIDGLALTTDCQIGRNIMAFRE